MAKFSLRNFVMKTLQSMKDGGEDEYKIMQYALKYYEKDVLTEDDLEEVQRWFEEPETGDPELPSEEVSDSNPELSEGNTTANETDLPNDVESDNTPDFSDETVSEDVPADAAENE